MMFGVIAEKYMSFRGSRRFIERMQFKKIKRIFDHARKHSPYYADLFRKAGLKELRSWDDFRRIPVLTKEDLIEHFDSIMIKDYPGVFVKTSGSSGQPSVILKDMKSIKRTLITGHPFFISHYAGVKIKKTALVLIWGEQSVETMFSEDMERFFKTEKIEINAGKRTEEILTALVSERPDLIISYPSVFNAVFELARSEGISLDFVKLLVLSAETINRNRLLELEDSLGCMALDAYISTEGGLMAIEVPGHDGFLLMNDNVYLEVNDDNGDPVYEKEGNVVITELNNFATPLLRYTGLKDRAVMSVNVKGKKYLKRITGRMIDSVLTKNGEAICPYAVTEFMEEFRSDISKFQVIQESPDSFHIKCVIRNDPGGYSEGGEGYVRLKRGLERFVSHGILLRVTVSTAEEMDGDIPFRVVKRLF